MHGCAIGIGDTAREGAVVLISLRRHLANAGRRVSKSLHPVLPRVWRSAGTWTYVVVAQCDVWLVVGWWIRRSRRWVPEFRHQAVLIPRMLVIAVLAPVCQHLPVAVVRKGLVRRRRIRVRWIIDSRDPIVGVARVSGHLPPFVCNGANVIGIVGIGVGIIDVCLIRMPDLGRVADHLLVSVMGNGAIPISHVSEIIVRVIRIYLIDPVEIRFVLDEWHVLGCLLQVDRTRWPIATGFCLRGAGAVRAL